MSSKHHHPLPETVFLELERASDSPGEQVTDADGQGSAPEFLISQAGGGAENVHFYHCQVMLLLLLLLEITL